MSALEFLENLQILFYNGNRHILMKVRSIAIRCKKVCVSPIYDSYGGKCLLERTLVLGPSAL